jgi:catechol 2,3-dioxygenase-like lactoylglutathione lyase family enzyme
MTTATAPRALRFHVALNASRAHFDATVEFYAKLFGMPPAKRKPGYAKFDVAEPPLNLSLNRIDAVPHGDLNHLGIQVWSAQQLEEARARLEGAGLALEEEHEVECCYARQNKLWATDPDGRKLELFHVLSDVETDGRQPRRALGMVLEMALEDAEAACCAPGKTCA